MILSCPQCAAQYRVRNESIPVEGATLQCPQCKLEVQAFPPDRDAAEILTVIKQLDAARAKLDAEYFDLVGSAARPEDNATPFQSWTFTANEIILESLTSIKDCMVELSSGQVKAQQQEQCIARLEQVDTRLRQLLENNPTEH